MTRSGFTALLAAGIVIPAVPAGAAVRIVTFRDRGCGCCEGWVGAARGAGYVIEMHDLERPERLRRYRIPEGSAGCHTSLVSGYVVEGHVPLDVIARLLRERPRVRGLALPGMPVGVPGMEGARHEPLDVMTLEPRPRVFARV